MCEKSPRLRYPRLASQVPRWNSASPADAYSLAVEQPVLLPDGRSGRRARRSGCRKSRSSHLYRSLHRQRTVSTRRGYGGRRNGSYCWRRYRRHSGRIADAARIVDRAVQSSRIRRPRSNAAHAGILGRRSRRRSQKTQHRNGEECHSADHPSAREDRNKLRAPHGSVIPCRLVRFYSREQLGSSSRSSNGAWSVSFETSKPPPKRTHARLSRCMRLGRRPPQWREKAASARSQHLGAARRASSRKAVAISGPILSIIPPCFGHTRMKCGAGRRRSSVNPPAAPYAGDIGLNTERQCNPR